METSSNLGGLASATRKRTRVLLSCAPCRASKLKCDRGQPCGQCEKKGRLQSCVYAPKQVKKRPVPKGSMTARLKRLEGMVRGMMDEQGNITHPQGQPNGTSDAPLLTGQVIHGDKATTYVGATHCLAMLEDIEDIKAYFDDPEESEDGTPPNDELESAERLIFSKGAPKSRRELLAALPEKHVVDKLVTSYFSSRSPSQHILHRPSFTRVYDKFWQDQSEAPIHWIALLFMIICLGVHFSTFSAPDEMETDSSVPFQDRIKLYRSCAASALILGKYTQPTANTIPAFILYVEADFLLSRAAQMNCYILSGVCMRLILKMGLHRDPQKLANITPFEGEMRRRQWNMASQVDLIVAFHMGLPSMVQGIETDTDLPRNLEDEDFDEDSEMLPPSRPETGYTSMTYAIHKSKLLRVFKQIAQQAHSLTPPSYAEVLKLDSRLHETWKGVPAFMHVKPLEECVGEEPYRIIQRYGLASLYHKCRCVLHRRYLAAAVAKPEHNYSRNQCLDAATTLLSFQYASWSGCRPGNILVRSGWFLSSLALHDFMLAAVILYLIIQNESYSDNGNGFCLAEQRGDSPTKEELINMIKRSFDISSQVFRKGSDLRKTADTLAIMLAKLGRPVGGSVSSPRPASVEQNQTTQVRPGEAATKPPALSPGPLGYVSSQPTTSVFGDSNSSNTMSPFPQGSNININPGDAFPSMGGLDSAMTNSLDQFDLSWMLSMENVDWRHVDASISQSTLIEPDINSTWMGGLPMDNMDIMSSDLWNLPPDENA